MVLKEIVVLDDRFEADVVTQALKASGIPYTIRQFGADGIDIAFQLQRGWGIVSVPEDRIDEAFSVIKEALAAQPEVPLDQDGNPIFPPGSGGGSVVDF